MSAFRWSRSTELTDDKCNNDEGDNDESDDTPKKEKRHTFRISLRYLIYDNAYLLRRLYLLE